MKPQSRRSGPWCPWAGVCGAARKRPGRQGQLQPEGAGGEGGAVSPEPRPGVQRAARPGLSPSSHLPFPCSSPARTRRPRPGSSGGWPGQRGGGRERGRSLRPPLSRCLLSTRCGPGTARLPCPVHRVDSCLEKQRGARWSDLDRDRTRPLEGPGASVLGPAQCGDLECSPQAQGGLRAGPASDRTISPCHFPHVY